MGTSGTTVSGTYIGWDTPDAVGAVYSCRRCHSLLACITQDYSFIAEAFNVCAMASFGPTYKDIGSVAVEDGKSLRMSSRVDLYAHFGRSVVCTNKETPIRQDVGEYFAHDLGEAKIRRCATCVSLAVRGCYRGSKDVIWKTLAENLRK